LAHKALQELQAFERVLKVFVYFDGQFSMLRSALATLLQSETTKRIFNGQSSMVNLQ